MTVFGLPEPAEDTRPLAEQLADDLIPPVYDEQTGEPREMTAEQRTNHAMGLFNDCNDDQKLFIQGVLARLAELQLPQISNEVRNLLLLQGEGGTGKTFGVNALIEMCHAHGIPTRACASTGIAATRLTGGCTAHSLFGIPVNDDEAVNEREDRPSPITPDSYRGELLKRTRLFIIDEIGMLHVDDINAINQLLKDLHRTSNRFGRVCMLFTGDARQLMPIVKGADPLGTTQAEASFFFSGDRQRCTVFTLTQNRRLAEGQGVFLNWQRNIGGDKIPHIRFPHDLTGRLTRYICIPRRFARYDEQAFVEEIYNRELLATMPPMQLLKRVILAPTNRIVDSINDKIVNMMPADRPNRVYLSTNKAEAYDVFDPYSAIFSAENLQSISPAKLPKHQLYLKVGTPVMCMQNIDVPNGICNGTLMVVECLGNSVVWCRAETRFGTRVIPIAPTEFTYKRGGFKFTRTQLPLRVAFCATVNRAQGGTYDIVGIHALHPLWAHGQLYTAITRVTSADGLTILCDRALMFNRNGEMMPTVRNVVHPRVSGRVEQMGPSAPATSGTGPDSSRPTRIIDEVDPEGLPEFQFYEPGQGAGQPHTATNHRAPPPNSITIQLAPPPITIFKPSRVSTYPFFVTHPLLFSHFQSEHRRSDLLGQENSIRKPAERYNRSTDSGTALFFIPGFYSYLRKFQLGKLPGQ
jgi:hypothetical protein